MRSTDRTRRPSAAGRSAPAAATLSEFDGVRYLHLGTPWVQGAMRLRKPRQLELEYVQRMMAWLLWRPEDSWSDGCAVQLGLGAGALTRQMHQVMRWQTTAVELNPSVIDACRLWFALPADDARLQVVQADAADWVRQDALLQRVDVLSVDLYDHEAAAPVLDDADFYAACRQLLVDGDAHTPGGMMVVNLFGRDLSFARSVAQLAQAFGGDQLWQLAPTREGNTIVLAGRGQQLPERELLQRRADAIEARYALPANKWLRLLKPLQTAER